MKAEPDIIRHPFDPFVPQGCTSLLLGSFPGSQSTGNDPPEDDWFYSAPRNQFWPIMARLFPDRDLKAVPARKKLFEDLGMAVTDVILSCRRDKGSNLDGNLKNRTYNTAAVAGILSDNPVCKVLFTGKGVRRIFERHFSYNKRIELLTLPSPSPAFFRMTLSEKVSVWRRIFEGAGLLPPG